MNRWKTAYSRLGFEALDHRWERVIIYGVAAAFWANLTIWLVFESAPLWMDGSVPGWAGFAALAVPGTARVLFILATGLRASTVVKNLAVLAVFAACGGYALTGGEIVDSSDSTTEPPRLRSMDEKRHMLELINHARTGAGAPPVVMGTKDMAQVQADHLLRDCVMSHWGTDGLKPYMRYSLAGGYQTNGENASTHNECGYRGTLLHWTADPMEMVADTVEGWLGSPGHRETMLNPHYRQVNIGLAWDRNTFKAIQHFEGGYVELDALPTIHEGTLEVSGRLTAGSDFAGLIPLEVLIVYDPPPRILSAGQLARTYCYGHGEEIGIFVPPSILSKDGIELTHTYTEPRCTDPYELGRSASDPDSLRGVAEMFQRAKARSESSRETEFTISFRKAEELTITGAEFYLRADMDDILAGHGPGVYTVVLVAELQEKSTGEPDTIIAEYSIFHQVRTPGDYAP